jgi:3-hydroxyisobutyrate dehydrogenase-like beta-hydroxyacid dehydrogenase
VASRRIGLIGAGMMGHGMAANLLKHGHVVTVLAHRNRALVDDLIACGANEAAHHLDLAHQSDIIILCVSTAEVVASTIAALKPGLRRGQIILDAGTTDPATTRDHAASLKALGVSYADIPLTGGPEQAEKAELGVLCGAEPEIFAAIEPVLRCFATTIRHFGPPGAGHTAKLISNYLVTGMAALVAESFQAARAADIDWWNLYDVMQNGSGNSGVLRKMVGPALEGDMEGYRFAIANAAKDISYYARLADQLGRKTGLTEAVLETYTRALAKGAGDRNVSHLLDPSLDPAT